MRATAELTPTILRDRRLASGEAADGTRCLTWRLAGEQYGIDILEAQKIRGWAPVTRAPNLPLICGG